MGAPIRLSEFVRAEPCEGESVKLVLVDEGGRPVVLMLELACLGQLLSGLPRSAAPAAGTVSEVSGWQLDAQQAGSDLTLTLQTADGRLAAFRLTAGQIAGMATVARHTTPAPPIRRSLH